MGRGTSNSAGSVFLHIADGKVVEKVSSDYPGAVKRINKKSEEVYERLDDYVDGVITSMYEKANEYNGKEIKELCIRVQGEGEAYTLSLGEGSRYWSAFAMRLPNLDLSKPVSFKPYSFTAKDTGKEIIGMNLFQGETKIGPKWTKENPGKLPQGKIVQYKGEDKWDFFDRDQFLLTVIRHFASQLAAQEEAVSGRHGETVQKSVTNDTPAAYDTTDHVDMSLPPSMQQPVGRNPKPLPTNPNPTSYQGKAAPAGDVDGLPW